MSRLFTFYDYTKPGRGVPKSKKPKDKGFGFSRFFRVLKDNFWKIIVVNLFSVALNFPIFFTLLGLTGNFSIPFRTPANLLCQPLIAAFDSSNPAYMALFGVVGNEVTMKYPSTTTIVLYCIGLICLFTFGLACTGLAYCLRGFSRGDHVDGTDFFRAIKKNWKQGMALGIVDCIIFFVIAFDVLAYLQNLGSGIFTQFGFWLTVVIAILYFVMRYYMYLLLVTFNLSVSKILKNSFIFSLLGIKRNVIATLGVILVLFINLILWIYIPPVGAVMPFILTFGLCTYISSYCAYPIVKRYMIDPYYEEKEPDADIEPVFTDRG